MVIPPPPKVLLFIVLGLFVVSLLRVALGRQVERSLLEAEQKVQGKHTRILFQVNGQGVGQKYAKAIAAQGFEASVVRKVNRVPRPGLFVVAADMKADLARITAETIRRKGIEASTQPLEEKWRLQVGPVFSKKIKAEQYRDALEKRGYDLNVMPYEEIKANLAFFVQVRRIDNRFAEQLLHQSLSRSGIRARVEEDT